LLVSLSALTVFTMGANQTVALAGGIRSQSRFQIQNHNVATQSSNHSYNNNYNFNSCNSGNQQIYYGQNSTAWCGNTYPVYSCGYFYKAQSGYDGFCNTGEDISFDKSDIVPFEVNIDCYPGGFKLYYYSRREGGRQNNYKGPLVCAYYPDRSRAQLKWLPQTYIVQPF
jgi:hypothetical protein